MRHAATSPKDFVQEVKCENRRKESTTAKLAASECSLVGEGMDRYGCIVIFPTPVKV